MRFKDVSGIPCPVLLDDGSSSMSLHEAIRHFNLPEETLARLWAESCDVKLLKRVLPDAPQSPVTPEEASKAADAVDRNLAARGVPMNRRQRVAQLTLEDWITLAKISFPVLAPWAMQAGEFVRRCLARDVEPTSGLLVPIVVVHQDRNDKGEPIGPAEPELKIITTVDYMRLSASITGLRKGELSPEFAGEDERWTQTWCLPLKELRWVRAGVLREGASAEFCQPINAQEALAIGGNAYGKRPERAKSSGNPYDMQPLRMLAKCALAASYRAAFPELLAGLYLSDEVANIHRRNATTNTTTPEEEERQRELLELAAEVDVPQNLEQLHAKLAAAGYAESTRQRIIDATRSLVPLLEERSFEAFADRCFDVARQRFPRGRAA